MQCQSCYLFADPHQSWPQTEGRLAMAWESAALKMHQALEVLEDCCCLNLKPRENNETIEFMLMGIKLISFGSDSDSC